MKRVYQCVQWYPGEQWLLMRQETRDAEKARIKREVEERLAADGYVSNESVVVRLEADEQRREVSLRASVVAVPK